MAEELKQNGDQVAIELPIDFHVPEGYVSRYATNLVVQHTEHEFIITFFEIVPPLILGTNKEDKLRNLDAIRAECVGRIIVARDRMPDFVEALRINLETMTARLEDNP